MLKKLVVPFKVKEFGEEDDFFTFEGYASTFGNVDLGDDVVLPGAFKDSIEEIKNGDKALPVLWQHDHDQPLGVFIELREDEKGLFVKGRLPKEDSFVSGRVIPQMKVGSISKMSIGYSLWRDGSFTTNDGIRELRKVKLWEISLVTTPMNPEASITNMKSVVPYQDLPLADRQRGWDADAAIGRIREFAGAEDGLDDPEAQAKYRMAFLWYDREDADLFGAYKLPIADIIDGEMRAVPRAIFAAAAALRGARGGVFLPSQERPGVVRNIERYYEKMGMESPFDGSKGFRIDDLSVMDEKTLESLLKNGVFFSGKGARSIISAIKSSGLRDADQGEHRDDEGLKGILESLNKATLKIKGD